MRRGGKSIHQVKLGDALVPADWLLEMFESFCRNHLRRVAVFCEKAFSDGHGAMYVLGYDGERGNSCLVVREGSRGVSPEEDASDRPRAGCHLLCDMHSETRAAATGSLPALVSRIRELDAMADGEISGEDASSLFSLEEWIRIAEQERRDHLKEILGRARE